MSKPSRHRCFLELIFQSQQPGLGWAASGPTAHAPASGTCWWSRQGQWCLILPKQLRRSGPFPVAWNAKLQIEQANRFSQGHWSGNWKRSVIIPIPKKGNVKECSNYCIITLISHASKVMLKILQARLQQYVNWELPDVPAGFGKGRGTRNQIANILWITEKARKFQKNIYFGASLVAQLVRKHLLLLHWLH